MFKDLLDNLHYGVCKVDKDRKIIYWNRAAERLTGFGSKDVLGKKFSLCKGRFCPVSNAVSDGLRHKSDVYLKRRGGGKIPVLVQVSPFFDSEKQVSGAIVSLTDNSSKLALVKKVQNLEKTASFDFLTKLHNRRLIEKELYDRLDELHRYGKEFGVVFIDVDHFKKINDTYGHDIGDYVLKMIAKKLLVNLRPFDFLGRWGGEEFLAIVTNVDKGRLRVIANRFRKIVESLSIFTGDSVVKVTVSLGATLARQDENVTGLMKRADELLYRSKTTGRNKLSLDARV